MNDYKYFRMARAAIPKLAEPEHPIDRLFVPDIRLEDAEVFEVDVLSLCLRVDLRAAEPKDHLLAPDRITTIARPMARRWYSV